MAEPPSEALTIRDFPGLNTRADPDDLPEGAAVAQVNLMSAYPGLLRVRPGYRWVVFEEEP